MYYACKASMDNLADLPSLCYLKVKVEKGETRYGPPKRSRRAPADHQQTGSEK